MIRAMLLNILYISLCAASPAWSHDGRGSARADILTAEFAVPGAMLPLCEGTNDLLPVTFTAPVEGQPSPEQFEVTIATLDGRTVSKVQPKCATLAPANEPDELQTVLLLGSFYDSEAGTGPVSVKVVGELSLNTGRSVRSVKGRYASKAPRTA